MKHSRSSSEWEIREQVVGRLRGLFPDARIIHELNVAGQGSNLIDVAAVTKTAIVGVEIKSAKDNLKRLFVSRTVLQARGSLFIGAIAQSALGVTTHPFLFNAPVLRATGFVGGIGCAFIAATARYKVQ